MNEDERREARRETNRRYYQSEKGQANEARRDKAKALAAYARYRQTPGYLAAQERRRVKDQANGWPIQTAARAVRPPEQKGAHQTVGSAIKAGTMVRPSACERCDAAKRLHAHHHLGYEREHWLDVQWLCSPCHRTVHR